MSSQPNERSGTLVAGYDDAGARQPRRQDDASIEVILNPGEFWVGDARYIVKTLLGSCVAIVLWHPQLRYGAMSHFILPSRLSGHAHARDAVLTQGQKPDGKYADEVIVLMVTELRQAGIDERDCTARVFGGGNMFPNQRMTEEMRVGQKNGDAARRLLKTRGIQIVAEDLFGIGHRQVIFDIASGAVWCKQNTELAQLMAT